MSTPPDCTYCLKPDADVCVRAIPTVNGPRLEFAHGACAEARAVPALYRLTPIEQAS